jgi:NAD-dependent deacetylase
MNNADLELINSASSLRAARRVVVFTGAGVSAESGIATFRDALTGLWSRFNAEDLATPEAFRRDPALVWTWYESRRQQVLNSQPNAAHHAIAALAQQVPQFRVITQNVDDLHERAGSAGVLHLHGSLFAARCFDCAQPAPAGWDKAAHPVDSRRLPPPKCQHCGGPVRPGVVWFGEQLPQDHLTQAFDLASQCDVLIAIGTSGIVRPAAELPSAARSSGATVIQINSQPGNLDAVCHHTLRGQAGELMPQLLHMLMHGSGYAGHERG